MNNADLDYLSGLKQAEPFTGFREKVGEHECRVQILGRGETAFVQLGERALLVEVLAGRAVIFLKSIRRWDTGEKVTDPERDVIVTALSQVMRRLGARHIEVVA